MDNDFNKVFQRIVDLIQLHSTNKEQGYVPKAIVPTEEEPPKYIPTPKEAGPKPITIEEYRARTTAKKPEATPKEEIPKRRSRGGRKVLTRRRIAELYRIVAITTDLQLKNTLLQRIKEEQQKYKKPLNNKT